MQISEVSDSRRLRVSRVDSPFPTDHSSVGDASTYNTHLYPPLPRVQPPAPRFGTMTPKSALVSPLARAYPPPPLPSPLPGGIFLSPKWMLDQGGGSYMRTITATPPH